MIRTLLKALSQIASLRDLLSSFSRHLELTCTALDKLLELIELEDNTKRATILNNIRELEREGDEIIRLLTIESMRLLLPPQQLQVLTVLLDKLDDMLDYVLLSGNELYRYLLHIRDVDFWKKIKNNIQEMILHTRDAVLRLNTMLRERKYEDLDTVMNTVSLKEQEVDKIKNRVLDELSLYADNLTCAELISLRNIILNIDEVADLAKDIATLLLVLRAISEI